MKFTLSVLGTLFYNVLLNLIFCLPKSCEVEPLPHHILSKLKAKLPNLQQLLRIQSEDGGGGGSYEWEDNDIVYFRVILVLVEGKEAWTERSLTVAVSSGELTSSGLG